MKTVNNVLNILEVFLNVSGEMGISELANLVCLDNSTVHRICHTLVERGYLYQKKKRGKYSAGTKFLQFQNAETYLRRIKDTAFPHLKKLSANASESVHIGIWDGNKVVVITNIFTDKRLQAMPALGEKPQLHCSSLGKLLLAYMQEEAIEGIFYGSKMHAFTENTITDFEHLKRELARIKQEEVAFDDEETEIGLRAVAAPVKDDRGNVLAAVGVLGPSIRISKLRMSELAPMIKNCASEISRALEYRVE